MNTSNAEANDNIFYIPRMLEVGVGVVANFYSQENTDPVDAEIAALINKPTKKELETQALLENVLEWVEGKNLLSVEDITNIKSNLNNLGCLIDSTVAEIQAPKGEDKVANIEEILTKVVIDSLDGLNLPEEVKAAIIAPISTLVKSVKYTKSSEEKTIQGVEKDGVAKVTLSRRRSNNR